MIVRALSGAELDAAARLRHALWPSSPEDEHRAELADLLAGGRPREVAFVALGGDGRLIGLAEASLRQDHVNGCETSPVAFLEGLYVEPGSRRAGVARALCAAVEEWGRASGCAELGSDVEIGNAASLDFHRALGFEERERVVFFRKRL